MFLSNSPKTANFSSFLLIVILGLVVYSNSLSGEFIWDDRGLIVENPYFKDWSNLDKVLTADMGKALGQASSYFRPLVMLVHMLQWQLFKTHVLGYHLINILVHILVAFLFFKLTLVLFNDKFLALLTAVLYVVHPIHTESVSYIVNLGNILPGLFMAQAIIFYVKCNKSFRIRDYLFMLLGTILACFSKENALVLPLLALSYNLLFKVKLKLKIFLPLLIVSGIYLFLRRLVVDFPVLHLEGMLARIPGFFAALFGYIRLLVLPFNLHLEYGQKIFSIISPAVIIGFFLFVLILFWLYKTSNAIFSFAICWFFVTLLPFSNIVHKLAFYMSEHNLYVPSFGFFLILAYFLRQLFKFDKFKKLTLILVLTLVAFYSILTIRQNNYWKNEINFFKQTLQYAPRSTRILNHLGKAYERESMRSEAKAVYKRIIDIDPAYFQAFDMLGYFYAQEGDLETALRLFKEAVAINPDYGKAYNNLAIIYYRLGRFPEAVESYNKALALGAEINPEFSKMLIPYL